MRRADLPTPGSVAFLDAGWTHVRLLFAIVPVTLFLALATSHSIRSGLLLEDSGYVLLRVAENFRLGEGPVFNPGEKRDLIDSPLWIGILSVLSFSTQAPLLVQLLALGLGLGVLFVVLAGPRLPVAGASASLFLALDGLFASRVTNGGSAILAGLYLVVLFLIFRSARGRSAASNTTDSILAWFVALAPLVRHELVCIVVPATLGWAITDPRRWRAWLPLGAALCSAGIWFFVRSSYFDAVPAYWEPWPPSAATVRFGAAELGRWMLRRPLIALGLVVMVSAWVRGPRRLGRGCGLAWGLAALAAFALLPAAGSEVVRGVEIALPLGYLMAVEAVWRGTRTRFGLVAALLLVAAQPAATWSVRTSDPEITASYVRLGQWLRAHAVPGTVVGARRVGALGYYSRLQMEDVQGRVSTRVAEARALRPTSSLAGWEGDFGLMWSLEPDLVLVAPNEPVPSATVYVPNLDATPLALRGSIGVYRWAGSPVWRLASP